jgi:tRNA threonylcarbamoyladenosine biosynthesis protein TsaE
MFKEIKIISKSADQTKDIAKRIARFLQNRGVVFKATIVGLRGELGGGKTTFIQGFISALGVKEKILSPTFVIMKNFELKNKCFRKVYHFDVYRINNEKEMDSLGFKDIVKDRFNLVLIEWSNLIEKIMPKDSILINFEFGDENTRIITIRFSSIDMFNKFKMLNLNVYGGK